MQKEEEKQLSEGYKRVDNRQYLYKYKTLYINHLSINNNFMR